MYVYTQQKKHLNGMHGKCNILRSIAVRFAYGAKNPKQNVRAICVLTIRSFHFVCVFFLFLRLFSSFFFSLEALKNISKTAATISQNVCVYISLKFHVAVDLMDFQQSKIRTEHHWLSNLMSDHFEFICRSALLWQEFFSE